MAASQKTPDPPPNPPDQVLTYATITTPAGDRPVAEAAPEQLKPGDNKPMPPKIFPPNQPIVEAVTNGYLIELGPRGGT